MAGQIPTRREVLEALSLAALASFAPGFSRWACAQQVAEHHHSSALVTPSPTPNAPYQPVAFSPEQYATVRRLCDLILPADGDAPGAEAAGVCEFIDFMLAHDSVVLPQFLNGLDALQALSRKAEGKSIVALSAPQANALLTRLAYREHFRPGDETARIFFRLARKYTVMGFYTSEIGYQALDSPNLKFYSESPGCPDPQDPGHRHAGGEHAA